MMTMKPDEYLKMIDTQLKEAEVNMKDAQKKFLEEKSKYAAVLRMKESYLKWVVGKDEMSAM